MQDTIDNKVATPALKTQCFLIKNCDLSRGSTSFVFHSFIRVGSARSEGSAQLRSITMMMIRD
jgi:hypothetical protein